MNMDKMQIARGKLAMFAGFWMALASKLAWSPDESIGTAATNGYWVKYNPKWIDTLEQSEVTFVAIHEIGHCMLAHMARLQGRDPRIANLAMDYALNLLLEKVAAESPRLDMKVPKCALLDRKYEGMTWESIYEELLKKAKENKKKNKGQQGDGLPDQFDDCQTPGDGTDKDGQADGSGGTAKGQAELDALAKDWTVTVQAAATMAKQMGKLPGFLEEFIGDLIKPKVDWRSQLANCMARVTKDEVSYRRFNRRHMYRGGYLPGYYSERIGPIGYFCDTSGSISSEEFKAAMGAMTDLLEDMKPERIHFGQCDTRLHSVQELTPDDLPLPPLKVVGRGGTDMKEAFEWACQNEQELDAFILQTDLYVPELDPNLIPSCQVIVIATTEAAVPKGWEDFNIVRVQL